MDRQSSTGVKGSQRDFRVQALTGRHSGPSKALLAAPARVSTTSTHNGLGLPESNGYPTPAIYYPQHERVQLPGWHPLYHEDVTMAETLAEAGYINSLISDVYVQFVPGRNFQRGFHSYQYIRGKEYDLYGTAPHTLLDVSDIAPPKYLANFPGLHNVLSQYKVNSNLWRQQGESQS